MPRRLASMLLLVATVLPVVRCRSRGASPIAISAHPDIVFMELPTTITVVATAGAFDTAAGSRARCQLKSVNNNYVNVNYTDSVRSPALRPRADRLRVRSGARSAGLVSH